MPLRTLAKEAKNTTQISSVEEQPKYITHV
jgi:hypothetical protein